MEKSLIRHIERVTKVRNLENMCCIQLVDEVILPKMAGNVERKHIGDDFMNLMAVYHYEIEAGSAYLVSILRQIALQRISNGAVVHAHVLFKPLPDKYRNYSSMWDSEAKMTEGCYNFIMSSAMAECLKDYGVTVHAAEILFGLMEQIDPDEKVSWRYHFLGNYQSRVQELYKRAEELVERYVSFDSIFEHYAHPEQWQKHLVWFSAHYDKIDWETFFQKIGVLKGNFVKKFFTKREIRRELYRLAASKQS